jgi:hypothetical protein
MEYKLQILELKKFLLIMLPSVLLSFIVSLYSILIYFNNIYYVPLAIAIPVLLFRFLQKKICKTTSFLFKNEGIKIQDDILLFSEIEGYHWDPNLTMDALNIKMKNGAIFRYTISKLDKPKENYKRFIKAFNASIKNNTQIGSELKYNEVHEKETKFMKPMIIFGSIALLGFGVFFALKGIAPPSSFYFMPGLLVFMYFKVYK